MKPTFTVSRCSGSGLAAAGPRVLDLQEEVLLERLRALERLAVFGGPRVVLVLLEVHQGGAVGARRVDLLQQLDELRVVEGDVVGPRVDRCAAGLCRPRSAREPRAARTKAAQNEITVLRMSYLPPFEADGTFASVAGFLVAARASGVCGAA